MNEYLRPRSLEEALEMRQAYSDHRVIAGGTDLMVGAGSQPHGVGMLDVLGVRELTGIEQTETGLRIGAATSYSALIDNDRIADMLPMLKQCASEIGAQQIQQRGTIGGNIITSSPVGDTLPVLLALDATVELRSQREVRRLAYEEFCTGYRQTALAQDELLSAIEIPKPTVGTRQYWRKVGTRRAQAISKVTLAATAQLGPGDVIRACSLAMGAVADRPIRLHRLEQLMNGQVVSQTLALQAHDTVTQLIKPIDDVRSSAAYRQRVAANLTARFIKELLPPT